VASATNADYLPWCATALLSAATVTPKGALRVHLIVDDDVGIGDRERLTTMLAPHGARIDFLPVDREALRGLPAAVHAHGGAISCARFLLPEQLPSVTRLIYLDADTLCVDSLATLWTTALDDAPIGAVRNVVEPAVQDRLRALGLADPTHYFNSGVLLMDLDALRERSSTSALLALVREQADRLLWVDQDALNLVHASEWAELAPRWNVQNSFWAWPAWAAATFGQGELAAARSDPAVLHFEGPSLAKPWHYLCRHPQTAAYRRAAGRTPWGWPTPVDRTWATRLIKSLPSSWQTPAYLRLLRARQRVRG
jgi:lipopolysaccharide biosynthesis glycosyltransferase